MSETDTLIPYITADADGTALSWREANLRSAQIADEERDGLAKDDPRYTELRHTAARFRAQAETEDPRESTVQFALHVTEPEQAPTDSDGQEYAKVSKPEPIPYRLVFAEDLKKGMGLIQEGPCPHETGGFLAVIAGPHHHEEIRCTILEIRTYGSIVSLIYVDGNGLQQSLVMQGFNTVKVAVD